MPKSDAAKAVQQSMKATAKTFGDMVLKGGSLTVPLNQRPWSWTEKQLADLVNDVVETTERWSHDDGSGSWEPRNSTTDTLPHFFGPFVLEQTSSAREVVDGQQRLTAITILVTVMRDINRVYCESDQPGPVRTAATAVRSALDQWLLADPSSGTGEGRLELDKTVKDFFAEYVLDKHTAEERDAYLDANPLTMTTVGPVKEIAKAVSTMHKKLRDALKIDDPATTSLGVVTHIREMHRAIRDVFSVIEITVTRDGYSPALFRGLNARGTGLTEADKIKNELFVTAQASDFARIKGHWDTILANTPKHDAEQFLRNRYIVEHGYVRKHELYDRTKQVELEIPKPLVVVKAWADDSRLARLTSGMEDPPRVSSEACRHLKNISMMDHSYVRPLLLAAAKKYLAVDQRKFATLVRLARNFGFREIAISGKPPETLLQQVAPICKKIMDGESLDDIAAALAARSPDDIFQGKFPEFHTAVADVQYYVLYELEVVAGGASGWTPGPHESRNDATGVNIEHILPRSLSLTPRNESRAWRGPEDSARKNNDLYRSYYHRIGNLLLIEKSINDEMNDHSPKAKISGNYPTGSVRIEGTTDLRRGYSDSQSVLAQQLVAQQGTRDWTPASINNRGKRLAELALRAWNLEASPASPRPTRRRAEARTH